jgi:hypothetical protein
MGNCLSTVGSSAFCREHAALIENPINTSNGSEKRTVNDEIQIYLEERLAPSVLESGHRTHTANPEGTAGPEGRDS